MNTGKIIVLSLVAILSTAVASFSCNLTVPSTVRSVTVFRDKAQIERVALKKMLDHGINMISIAGLANDINDESVRVSGSGTADAAIVEVKVEPDYSLESNSYDAIQLKYTLDSLGGVLEHFRDQLAVLTTQRDFILALKTPATQGMPAAQRMSMKEFQELMSYVSKTLADISDQQRAFEIKTRKVNDLITVYNKRLQDIRSQNSKVYKRIVVRVDANKVGDMELVFTYVVGNASWTPSYDAHVNTATGDIEWTSFGNIRQETGENWENVKLTLSTANPVVERDIPVLSAWFLHPQEPVPTFGFHKMSRGSGLAPAGEMSAPSSYATLSDGGDGLQPEMQKARTTTVAVEDELLATTFTIDVPMTIPSDQQAHKATIASSTLKGNLQFVGVPRLSRDVFFRASTSNTSGTPFLSGPVNIFVDHQFIASTTIPTTVNSDSLQLALGTNDAVKTERRLVSKIQEYNGILNKTFKWNYEYLTTLTNNAKTDVTIDMLDQVPISQNEKIIIETQSISPAANETNDQKIMTWHLQLKPGEKKEIKMKYSVEYPRDMKIAGLE